MAESADMEERASIRRRTWEVLDVGTDGDQLSRTVDMMIMALVFGSVVATILESVVSLRLAYQDLFVAFEHVSVAAFTAEFLCRLWSSADARPGESETRNRIRYLCSPFAIVDLIAIAPFYLIPLLGLDLRFLRIVRLLRLVKLTRYSAALSRVYDVYRLQRSALAASFFLMAIAIVVSASLLYVIEHAAQPEAFSSIPAAMWWAVCTLTTVGYGDVAPITPIGKLVTSFVSIVGIAMVALPTSLFASGFAHIMERDAEALEEEVQDALADGIITEKEMEAFEELAERLHVEPEMAREIFASAQRRGAFHPGAQDCPHCGKSIEG